MKFLFALFVSTALCLWRGPMHLGTYHGHKVYRVVANSWQDVMLIESAIMNVGFDTERAWDLWTPLRVGLIDIRVPPSSQDYMEKLEIAKWVYCDDIDALIANEMAVSVASDDYFSKYHTMNEITAWMQSLTNYSFVKIVEIGKTFENRPIQGLFISVNSTAPHVVLHGLEHAREWISGAVVSFIANELITNKDPKVKDLLNKFQFTIVPVLNVDGFIFTQVNRMWRKNRQSTPVNFCIGTDINRNWGFKWDGQGSSSWPCSDIYRGTAPFSSPEATSMADYLLKVKPIVYIDFHAYSQLWMYPFGFDCSEQPKDLKLLSGGAEAAVKAIASVNGIQFVAEQTCDLYPVNGDSIDYAYNNNITFSYAVELRDKGQYGFILPPSMIVPSGLETFAGVQALLEFVDKQ